MRFLLAIAISVLAFTSAHGSDPKAELKGVRQEISAKKKLISSTRKVEAAVSTELQQITRSLDQKKAELSRLDNELKGVERDLGHTGGEIDRVTAEANRKKLEIDKRLVSLYKAGELGASRMFFSAESFPQVAENIRYMSSILDGDKKLFVEYNNKIEELRKLKESLEKDAVRKERIKGNIKQKKLEYEQEKGKKTAYLTQVRQDRKGYETSLKELQANASRLQSMLDRLDVQSRKRSSGKPDRQSSKGGRAAPDLPAVPDRGFSSQKGRMKLPARGEIVETYGKHKHPEFNSYTFSKGLSIAASAGSDIRSIYDGTVIFADHFKGYGNMVIIDHGGGYFSLYAHASKIMKKVGSEVSRNDTVALVGDTDSARGALLYFEIRHQGKPVDPSEWVR